MDTKFDEEDATTALTEFFRYSTSEHRGRVSGIPQPFVVQTEIQQFETNPFVETDKNKRVPQEPLQVLGVPQPGIDAIVPNYGSYTGGTTCHIIGRDFTAAMEVRLDGVLMLDINFINSTSIYAVTPPHARGVVDLTVGLPGDPPFTLPNAFRYTQVHIDSIDPTSGGTGGGTEITLFGEGFIQGAQVKWGLVNSIGGTYVSSTQLTAISPPHAEGVVDVSVVNPDGQNAVLPNSYTYGPEPGIAPVHFAVAYTGSISNHSYGGAIVQADTPVEPDFIPLTAVITGLTNCNADLGVRDIGAPLPTRTGFRTIHFNLTHTNNAIVELIYWADVISGFGGSFSVHIVSDVDPSIFFDFIVVVF